jgi:hypothetical protein
MDRKDFCPYCGQQFSRLKNHVINKHSDQAAVRKLINAEDTATEKKIVARLKNAGNNNHNISVLSSGSGSLIVARAPNSEEPFHQKQLPCSLCSRWFSRKLLYRHEEEKLTFISRKHRNQTINRKGACIISRRPSHGQFERRCCPQAFLRIFPEVTYTV